MQFVASNTYSKYYDNGIYAPTNKQEYFNDSYENDFTLKYDLNYRLSPYFNFNFSTGWKKGYYNSAMFTASDTTPTGYFIPENNFKNILNTNKLFGSINFTSKIFNDKLILNTGFRFDYFDYINNKSTISPRFGLSYAIFPNTNLNASYGVFYQTPVYTWLISDPANKSLNSIRCDHYILGIEHFFTPEIKTSVEIYQKEYNGYAVSNSNPRYILIDGGADYGPNIIGSASSSGHGYVKGVDFMIQKKLSGNGLYGMVNYSYSSSGFIALAGDEKPGAFDPTHQFTIIAGYQVADDWLIGLKLKYAGGKPYTPFDIEASKFAGHGVYDMNKFNGINYPDYSRLDLRVDKKFIYRKSTITAYFELQNVYNRENIFGYFWNKAKNEVGTIYQWAFMPVGGFNIEF